jgi:translocation and assembly module TamB
MRQKAIILGLVALLIVYIAGALWQSQSHTVMAKMEDLLTEELTKAMGSSITIGRIEVSRYNEITLYDVVVRDGETVIATDDKVTVSYNILSLLMGKKVGDSVKEVAVYAPRLLLTKTVNGKWNIDELLERARSGESTFSGKILLKDAVVNLKLPEGEWQFAAINGSLDFAHKPRLTVTLSAEYDGSPVNVEGLINQQGASRLEVRSAAVKVDSLRSLLPQGAIQIVGGKVTDLIATLKYEKGELTYAGEGKFDGLDLKVDSVPVSQVKGLATFTDKDVYLFGVSAKVYGQDVRVSGKIATATIQPIVDLEISAKAFDLHSLSAQIPVDGKMDFTATLTGSPASLAARGEVKLDQGNLNGYAVSNLTAKLTYREGIVNITKLDGKVLDGTVNATGSFDIGNNQASIYAEAHGINIAGIPGLEQLQGRGDLAVSYIGDASFAAANAWGTVTITDGTYQGVPFTRLSANFNKAGQKLDIRYLTLNFDNGVVTASGMIDRDKISIKYFGQGVPLHSVSTLAGGAQADGNADCEGEVSGTIQDPIITTKFTAYNGHIFSQPFSLAKGNLLANRSTVTLDNIEVINGSTKHRVQGTVGIKDNQELNLTINSTQARAEDLVKVIMPGERVTGNVDAEIRVSGTITKPIAQGQVKLYDGSFRGQLIAKAEGMIRYNDGNTELQDFFINSLNTQVRLTGTITQNNALNFSVTAKDIDVAALRFDLPYPVAGRVVFEGELTGTVASPVFNGRVSAATLRINNQELNSLDGKITLNGNQLDIPQFSFNQGAGSYRFSGGLNITTKDIYGNLSTNNGNLAGMLAVLNITAKGVDGRLDGQVTLGGTLTKPNVWLTGKLTNGKIKNYPLDNIDVDILYKNNVVTINRFYAKQGDGVLAATGTAAVDGPLNLEVGGRGIDAGLLTTWFDASITTKGKMNFAAQITGNASSPHAAISLEIANGAVANATFDSLYGLFVLDQGSINVNQLMLTKGPYRASAYGTIPLAALSPQGRSNPTSADQMNLKVKLEQANLSILPMLTDNVAWAVGDTRGEITVAGTLAQPLIYGGVTVNNGTVKLASLAEPIQNVGVDIQFEGDKINIKSFDGKMGAGTYRLNGTAKLNGLALTDYNIVLALDNLSVKHKYFSGPLNGTLMLTSSGGKPNLSGKVIIENVTANIPYIPDFVKSDLDIGLDLDVLIRKKVHLYNPYMYNLWVDGHVKFSGSTQAPSVAGRINAVRGSVSYFRTQFNVTDGALEFTQFRSLIPVVKLNAETNLENTKVLLAVYGPADAIEFKLNSEPAMSQQEILSLLTLRSHYYDKNTASAGIGRDELKGLLDVGLKMRFISEAESVVRDYLGLDDFRLVRGTLVADSTNSSVDREVYNLEISKYVTERLMLSYTMGVYHKEHSASFRYDLSRRFSITGSQDEQDRRQIGIETRFKF